MFEKEVHSTRDVQSVFQPRRNEVILGHECVGVAVCRLQLSTKANLGNYSNFQRSHIVLRVSRMDVSLCLMRKCCRFFLFFQTSYLFSLFVLSNSARKLQFLYLLFVIRAVLRNYVLFSWFNFVVMRKYSRSLSFALPNCVALILFHYLLYKTY